jgi:hypothetical protein
VPRGGRRQGAGRKPKTPKQHFLSGNAGKRKLALVPSSREELGASEAESDPEPALVMPVDRLAQDGEQAYWAMYADQAVAAGTLTTQTVGGFILLCQIAARADRMWEDIEREGFTWSDEGVIKAHPLLPAYRGLVQRHESLLQRYLLAAMAKAGGGNGSGSGGQKEDDDGAALRQLMAIK